MIDYARMKEHSVRLSYIYSFFRDVYNSKPTTFWITNPQTFVRNNVAAGSEVKLYRLEIIIIAQK